MEQIKDLLTMFLAWAAAAYNIFGEGLSFLLLLFGVWIGFINSLKGWYWFKANIIPKWKKKDKNA